MHTDFSDLKGKNCVITGGAGVIGSAITECLAKAGIRTAILDLNGAAATATAAGIVSRTGGTVIGVEGNVLEKDSLSAAKKAINDQLGPIDILINGAGGNSPKATTAADVMMPDGIEDISKTFFGLETDGFKRVFDLNFIGTVLPSMILARDMVERKKGVVLNISSMNSFRPLTRIPAYSAAKASINNFTCWLAVHCAPLNIRVNAIAPGFFLTEQNRFLLTEKESGELTARGKKILQATPMGRFGSPEELQGAVLYLISDISQFVTGVVLPIDGGFNAYSGV